MARCEDPIWCEIVALALRTAGLGQPINCVKLQTMAIYHCCCLAIMQAIAYMIYRNLWQPCRQRGVPMKEVPQALFALHEPAR